jgi:hypothetical protein
LCFIVILSVRVHLLVNMCHATAVLALQSPKDTMHWISHLTFSLQAMSCFV